MLSRRDVFRCLVGGLAFRRIATPLEVERLERDSPLPSISKQTGSYRADAAISFLGMTVLRRKGVGGGSIEFEEAQNESLRKLNITFKAGSLPDRAGGLNRVGYIQEICVEEKSKLREAAYFGIMTSSPEESFADAKGALNKQDKDGLRYTAIDGVNLTGRGRSASHRWIFPADFNWSRFDALVTTAVERTRSAESQWRQLDSEAGTTPATFLYVVLRALQSDGRSSESKYMFGPERFHLKTEKIPESSGVTRLKGEIFNEMTRKKTHFNVWFKANTILPTRIEFQPKSYLRLVFETV
ncbi:MAG TPA: hypothetical protein VEX68_31075 [Bryobacteraceae bacterium]|nr:hypothetical protein [Bryobacteraceae bacterium]